jgi:1,2-diacylglycerol 3-beta-galactosyltransferase
VQLLTGYWKENRPDMVVSVVPNFNRALFESLRRALPAAPMVTILTDLADYPPHFWIEKQPQYFICGTKRARAQALAMGHPPERVFLVSGMILRPQFYQTPNCNPREERKKLGLDPDLPTALVLFGGEGSNVMVEIARRLGNINLDLQLILICGRNQKLRARLQALRTRNRMFVEGLTKDIPYYMHLSDFMIGKAGPGSISEAIRMGLPVIVERNAWTLPQERYNAEWIEERGVGIVLKNFRGIESAVRDLLTADRLESMKKNIACCMDNRALYEIPPILERILANYRRG